MPWKWYVGLVLGGIAILMMVTIVPIWEWFPVQITEQGRVLAITKEGCVIQAQTVDLPIIQKCNAQVGETVDVTYFVPSKVTSGYYQKLTEKASLIQP